MPQGGLLQGRLPPQGGLLQGGLPVGGGLGSLHLIVAGGVVELPVCQRLLLPRLRVPLPGGPRGISTGAQGLGNLACRPTSG
eukprot:5107374-Pyramimonas_sp.AAC.1